MQNVVQYVTEQEVHKMTGIALSTLRNNRFNGRGIPYCKVGRSIRYDLTDVINYMETRKHLN